MKKILMGFAAFLLVVAASPVVGRAQQPQNNQQYPPQYDNGSYNNGGQWPQDQGSLPPYPNQAPPPPGQGIPYPPQGSQPQAGPPPGPQGRRVRLRDRTGKLLKGSNRVQGSRNRVLRGSALSTETFLSSAVTTANGWHRP